jgi:hypothetical protein
MSPVDGRILERPPALPSEEIAAARWRSHFVTSGMVEALLVGLDAIWPAIDPSLYKQPADSIPFSRAAVRVMVTHGMPVALRILCRLVEYAVQALGKAPEDCVVMVDTRGTQSPDGVRILTDIAKNINYVGNSVHLLINAGRSGELATPLTGAPVSKVHPEARTALGTAVCDFVKVLRQLWTAAANNRLPLSSIVREPSIRTFCTYFSEFVASPLATLLLEAPTPESRDSIRELLQFFVSKGTPELRQAVLKSLCECQTHIPPVCACCGPLYDVLAELASLCGEEPSIARFLLSAALSSTPFQDGESVGGPLGDPYPPVCDSAHDQDLIGRLKLATAVVKAAGADGDEAEMTLRIWKTGLMRMPSFLEQEGLGEMTSSKTGLAAASQPLCQTPRSRTAAMDLLCALAVRSEEARHKLFGCLSSFVKTVPTPVRVSGTDVTELWQLDTRLPQFTSSGMVGLANQGATCYLNAVVQALFHCPGVREIIGTATVRPPPEGKEFVEVIPATELLAASSLGGNTCPSCTYNNEIGETVCSLCQSALPPPGSVILSSPTAADGTPEAKGEESTPGTEASPPIVERVRAKLSIIDHKRFHIGF